MPLSDFLNKITCINAIDGLKSLPNNCIDMAVTSPPYWGKRDYKSELIIFDGECECEHEWQPYDRPNGGGHPTDGALVGNTRADIQRIYNYKADFCSKCGAWKGQLGLEPKYTLYINHLCDIFDEVYRTLKPTGTCWVNIGDTYSTHAGASKKHGHNFYSSSDAANEGIRTLKKPNTDLPEKSLICIPDRFKIEMVSRGWICRSEIIWFKRNCMPESVDDRFTVDYEKLFFFVKSSDTQFWTNEKTLQLVTEQPMGLNGIKGSDWDIKQCPVCFGSGMASRPGNEEEYEYFGIEPKQISIHEEKCDACGGSGEVTSSLWTGHDYYFEQQFESLKEESKRRAMRGVGVNKVTIGDYLPKGMHAHTCHQPRTHKGYENMDEKIAAGETPLNPNGKRNKRCVWDIPPKPFKGAHFAVFPDTLIETPIKAGCPEQVCIKCGMPRQPIFISGTTKISDCECNAGWRPGIVLDMFMGSGTTARKARSTGRDFVGFDISPEYVALANNQLAQKTMADWMGV